MTQRANPERRGIAVGAAVALAGLLLLTVPSLLGLDGMSGGFALGAVGLLLVICGAITVVLFLPRARVLGRMLRGDDLLVHWEYDSPQVTRQVARDKRTELGRNRGLLLIVAIWWVIWVAFFMVLGYAEGNGDDMPLFVGIMLGVGLVVAAAGLGIPHLRARRALSSTPEAIVGRHALYLNGTFHPWDAPLAALDRVTLEETTPEWRLVFHLRALNGPGWLHWVPYKVEVPVPVGQHAKAQEVAQALSR